MLAPALCPQCMKMSWNELKNYCVAPPYVMHREDWLRFAPLWHELTHFVRSNATLKEVTGYYTDMITFSVALIMLDMLALDIPQTSFPPPSPPPPLSPHLRKVDLRNNLAAGFLKGEEIMKKEWQEAEGRWQPGFMPYVIHFCQRYDPGPKRQDLMFAKHDYHDVDWTRCNGNPPSLNTAVVLCSTSPHQQPPPPSPSPNRWIGGCPQGATQRLHWRHGHGPGQGAEMEPGRVLSLQHGGHQPAALARGLSRHHMPQRVISTVSGHAPTRHHPHPCPQKHPAESKITILNEHRIISASYHALEAAPRPGRMSRSRTVSSAAWASRWSSVSQLSSRTLSYWSSRVKQHARSSLLAPYSKAAW